MITPHVQVLHIGTCHPDDGDAPDREMRCDGCATRVFSSRAPELVASGEPCPRCSLPLALVPL